MKVMKMKTKCSAAFMFFMSFMVRDGRKQEGL